MKQRQIVDMIEKFDKIIIHHHVRPDGDCLGSQFGLKAIIEASYPNKKVYAVGEQIDKYEFMGHHDNIEDSVYEGSLVIIVDVGDERRVHDQRFSLCEALIKIDHHPFTYDFGVLEWVDPTFAAAAEMIYDLYYHNKDRLRLTDKGAEALFTGILTDTGRFYFNSVTSRTLSYGSELYAYDFSKEELYKHIYVSSINEAKFKGYVLANFEITENGLGYMKLTNDLIEKFNLSPDIASSYVNTLSNIEGIVMWIFFTEDIERRFIRTGFRSRGPVVNELAKKYGGGGHRLASGTLVDNWDSVDNVIKDADEICLQYNK